MRALSCEKVNIKGDLGYRILKNYSRLTDSLYRPEHLFQTCHGWPGDWPGRTILALVLHGRITGFYPPYLDEIMEALEKNLEDHGYLGEADKDIIDEQSISGHNWLLRGLMAYWEWTGKEETVKLIRRLVRERYWPLVGKYRGYSVDPRVRDFSGGADGNLSGAPVNGWRLSTDIGCAFMPLDALSLYLEKMPDEKVALLAEEMAEKFMKIDFVGASMQTHASLSACRGLLRLGSIWKRERYIEFVRNFFELYQREGMTENYANFNWFGRPSWTEPCAIVDSILLSMELYLATGNEDYVEIFHKIYYNGLRFAQRQNGGFGCDDCVSAKYGKIFLKAQREHYEASWCCSMRGAEGLTYVASYSLLEAEDEYRFCGYFPMDGKTENISYNVRTEFPDTGNIEIRINELKKKVDVFCYVPKYYQIKKSEFQGRTEKVIPEFSGNFLRYTISEPGILKIEMEPKQVSEIRTAAGKEYVIFWKGICQMGVETDRMLSANAAKVLELEPLGNRMEMDKEKILEQQFQVLFPV